MPSDRSSSRTRVAGQQAPDVAHAVVAEHVDALQVGDGRAPVDEPAGDRAVAVGVGVVEHRGHRAGRGGAALVGLRALHLVPAEVGALARRRGRGTTGSRSTSSMRSWPTSPIQRSPLVAVEREPPRVAHAVEPDLGRARPDAVGERVAGRDGVGRSPVGRLGVDAQDLAEQGLGVLAVAVGVAAAAPVAEPDVEVAVGAEHQLAAVVVRERLGHEQQLARGCGCRPGRRPSGTRRRGCCRRCRCSRRRACGRRSRTRCRAGPARRRSRSRR